MYTHEGRSVFNIRRNKRLKILNAYYTVAVSARFTQFSGATENVFTIAALAERLCVLCCKR
jgi:hypothetical protein